MAYRTTVLVAVISTVALACGPAVADTWLPSWLDNVVNGNSGAASSADPASLAEKRTAAQEPSRPRRAPAGPHPPVASPRRRRCAKRSRKLGRNGPMVRKASAAGTRAQSRSLPRDISSERGRRERSTAAPVRRTPHRSHRPTNPRPFAHINRRRSSQQPAPVAIPEIDGRNMERLRRRGRWNIVGRRAPDRA